MVIIYFISVQHMIHRMRIMQERSEYDLMTNSVKFMQQTSSALSVGDSNVCDYYLLQYTYLINNPEVTASVENVHLWQKHRFADVYAIHWCELR